MERPVTFWGSAAGVAMAFAGLVPVLFPFRRLGLVTAADQGRVWLLVVFIAGVVAILFGTAALLGGPRMITVRDVVDEGGVAKARASREAAARARAERRTYGNAATWLMTTGAFLVAIYFVLWAIQG
jgi:hypothetical protein